MLLWMNWRTKTTHLFEDCHQIARVPVASSKWLEEQEDSAAELTSVGRRYCSWCVSRALVAIEKLPPGAFNPDADLHPPAERADYVKTGNVRPRQ